MFRVFIRSQWCTHVSIFRLRHDLRRSPVLQFSSSCWRNNARYTCLIYIVYLYCVCTVEKTIERAVIFQKMIASSLSSVFSRFVILMIRYSRFCLNRNSIFTRCSYCFENDLHEIKICHTVLDQQLWSESPGNEY